MMSADPDPMQENTRKLVEALTTARSVARTSDGSLAVEACADGEVRIHIEDRALRSGGAAVSAELTRLAAQALAAARAGVREATATLRADPRIAAALEATQDAMDRPLAVEQPQRRDPPPQPVERSPATYDPYDYEQDEEDRYYQRKSWLEG